MSISALQSAGLVYVATPYSKFERGIDAAFLEACRLTAELVKLGIAAYSPIAHSHPVAIHGGIDPYDYKVWLPLNAAMIPRCDALCVMTMDGWDQSYGVKLEIQTFKDLGKPVYFLSPKALQ